MNGIIIINKQKGCTSHDNVYKIKKMFNEKIGHTGTLDPMAEGVLPILIGKGTLVSKYLVNHDKKYIVKLQLGIQTDTADSEGKILKELPVENMQKSKINEVLKTFIGRQEQIPPIYSAIKINGKKLYEYARKGQTVEIKPRTIEIYNIKLIHINDEKKQIEFEVFCGKGTYIRSLCENIAEKLGTVGYMKALKRTQVGEFNIENSITIEDLEKNKNNINDKIISIEKLFEDKEKIILDTRKLKLFLNGVKLTQNYQDGVYRIYDINDNFVGIGVIHNNLLKRDIIINSKAIEI